MNKIKIHLIAAARPNFMKIAPLYHALDRQDWAEPVIVHTGQHYDLNMSDVFFRDLQLPTPHIHLGIGSGSHAEQTGRVMMAYEAVLQQTRPDLVVVVGDVNSTMACTLAAVKIPDSNSDGPEREGNTKTSGERLAGASDNGPRTTDNPRGHRPLVAHLEAGLRSGDRSMPEEINRLVTDALADILWTPSADGDDHLQREGIPPEKIDRVGNIMIDSLEMVRDTIEEQETYRKLGLEDGHYGVVTLHRPANVDDPKTLKTLCESLAAVAARLPLAFPLHPRTRKSIQAAGLQSMLDRAAGLKLLEPLAYREFMNLVFHCRLAVTDSGGIQEETSYLGIPCLTLRPNTERPVTITAGTNRLCRVAELEARVDEIMAGPERKPCRIALWDGQTAGRVVRSIRSRFGII
jgi:UDP-N-acetylglucosamine 2-epimerase (non-hydrolysing)